VPAVRISELAGALVQHHGGGHGLECANPLGGPLGDRNSLGHPLFRADGQPEVDPLLGQRQHELLLLGEGRAPDRLHDQGTEPDHPGKGPPPGVPPGHRRYR